MKLPGTLSLDNKLKAVLQLGLLLSCCVLGLWLLLGSESWAQADQQRQREQDMTRQRLQRIRAEIQQLQDERDSGDDERNALNREQRRVEVEIGEIRKEVRQLDQGLRLLREELNDLTSQQEQAEQQLSQRQRQLAEQLTLAYRLGQQSRLKLLFNLEDPALSSRLLAYHGYFTRAQAERIQAVTEQLDVLRQLALEVSEREQTLSQYRQQRASHLGQLELAYGDRKEVLLGLDRKLATLSARIGELRANQRDLEQLLQRLQNALTDIPDTLGDQPFRELLGHLRKPVSGGLSLHFGQPQQDGRPGTGVVFNAKPGTDVRSVGYGRVAFADWLRGYGLLMIIDHGDGYMSLYGRNESLLHEAGDWVEADQVVAVVGQGNLDAPAGLYFELRKDGQAVDPERWFRRR